MLLNREKTKSIAAVKAGMDEKTARKYARLGKLPSQCKKERTWRTREDAFARKWPEIKQMLHENPGLEAKTIFEFFQRANPGKFADGQLRTLQRQIKVWRATAGPAREVYFPQIHKPGELCASDFTDLAQLGVTINRAPFPHLIYHFVLTYSNWETGTVCFSESYESLSTGLQNALWQLGGVPQRHRSDRLSAAVHKDCNPEVFTQRYQALLRHYNLQGERIQAGKANENGDIEQRHNRFKKALAQALMLRGSSDFRDRGEYHDFLRKLFDQLNAGRQARWQEELRLLARLPQLRLDDRKEEQMRVRPGSTVRIQKNTYSVHSRMIGERVKARIYMDHIEIWYGQRKVDQFPRLRGSKKHQIQYQHIIEWLVRKPGAFANYRYREELFPSSHFRMAYDHLRERHEQRPADKQYLGILLLAAREGEMKVEAILRDLITQGGEISLAAVTVCLTSLTAETTVRDVAITPVDLTAYDALCSASPEVCHAQA